MRWNVNRLAPAAAVLVVVAGAAAAVPTETALVGTGVQPADQFGFSVAVSGGTAVVGALGDVTNRTYAGEAYVFVRSGGTWQQQQKLRPPGVTLDDVFGYSVGVSGDTAIVSADGQTGNAGAAYVFVRSGSTWSQEQRLVPSDPVAGKHFAWSVAVSGDVAVVGAPYDATTALNSGAAYVFVRSGGVWTQEQKLTASNPALGDVFGWSVAVDGGTIVVGAPGDDDAGDRSGAAYVFTRSGGVWSQAPKLRPSDGAAHAGFGWSVAVSGDTAAVGAPEAGGRAYVFARSGSVWPQQQRLTTYDGTSTRGFGIAIGVSGDTVVVGDEFETGSAPGSGVVYAFVRSGGIWSQARALTGAGTLSGDEFGSAVAVSGDVVVAGMTDYAFTRNGASVFDVADTLVPAAHSFVAPAKAKVRRNTRTTSLAITGYLDTGPGAVGLAGPMRLDVGENVLLGRLDPVAGGAKLRYRTTRGHEVEDLVVVPAADGRSRAEFRLTVKGFFAWSIDPDKPLQVRFANASLVAAGAVGLQDGSYAAGSGRGSLLLVGPALVPLQLAAKIPGGGKDSLALVAALAPTPAKPPTVAFAFNSFAATIQPADFKESPGDRFTAKNPPSAPGVALVVVDYRKSTVTVKAKGADLGAFGAGPAVPVKVTVTLNGVFHTVDVVAARNGTSLAY